jgi:hypothetical protein
MTEYRVIGNVVIRKADGAIIPNAPGNSDWNSYQAYVAAGGVTDPEYTSAELDTKLKRELRAERTRRLQLLDYYGLADVWMDLSAERKTELKAYRQALRDLPANTPDPTNVLWPLKPSWAKENEQ